MKFSDIIKKLTECYQDNKFDEMAEIPEMKLVEKRSFIEDKEKKQDCIKYVTQQKQTKLEGEFSFSAWRPTGYCPISRPKPDDFIVYHRNPNGTDENHIGIYKGNNSVLSKFGYGHVFEHPFNFVPEVFGPYLTFYTKQRDSKLGEHATIENMDQWVEVYRDIVFIQLNFPQGFSGALAKKIRSLIDSNSNFLKLSGSFSFSLETKETESSQIYRVLNKFLKDHNNRQMLREIYAGTRENFVSTQSDTTNDISTAITNNKRKREGAASTETELKEPAAKRVCTKSP